MAMSPRGWEHASSSRAPRWSGSRRTGPGPIDPDAGILGTGQALGRRRRTGADFTHGGRLSWRAGWPGSGVLPPGTAPPAPPKGGRHEQRAGKQQKKATTAETGAVDMKLEVLVIPVSDI